VNEPDRAVYVHNLITARSYNRPRALQRNIDDLSRLRFTLAHEDAHLHLDWDEPDPTDSRSPAEILRFIDGFLAALRLLLLLVLTALSQQLDALSFVLVMLAACLRYGRRAEPGDHDFLPMRRNLTSLGSCPHA
jgi:hypothetical protein